MSGFTFTAAQTSQSGLGFNFGNKPTTSTTFGAPATTASNVFGSSSLFTFPTTSTATSTAPSFGLNTFNPTSSSTFPSSTFGSSSLMPNKQAAFAPTGSMFQTAQQRPPQSQQPVQQAIGSLFAPKIYNDERDNIVGMFNSLQAFWGTGKAYYSAFNPPYEFSDTDQFNRFKTISYSEIKLNEKDNDQIVMFLIKFQGDESQLKTNLLTYEQNFKQIVGNNFTVKLELKNILPESKAVVSIVVTENATSKAIPDAQLQSHFNQPNSKQQLNNVFGGNFVELLYLSLSKQELETYLSVPPKGIDERIWTQAKLENPDASRFIPLPLIGFNALNNRFKMQEKEIQQQQMRLKQIIDSVTSLETDISQFKAKFEECRRKHCNLSYHVLRKMIAQEVQRKRTLPIQAEEDKLRASLEAIQSELSVPTKFQGCLNELMSQLRQMQCQTQLTNTVTPDIAVFNEFKQFLKEENEGIMSLVQLLSKDMEDIDKLQGGKPKELV